MSVSGSKPDTKIDNLVVYANDTLTTYLHFLDTFLVKKAIGDKYGAEMILVDLKLWASRVESTVRRVQSELEQIEIESKNDSDVTEINENSRFAYKGTLYQQPVRWYDPEKDLWFLSFEEEHQDRNQVKDYDGKSK